MEPSALRKAADICTCSAYPMWDHLEGCKEANNDRYSVDHEMLSLVLNVVVGRLAIYMYYACLYMTKDHNSLCFPHIPEAEWKGQAL